MTSPDSPKHTNRLIDATSPYLLQHAHNPVDWYPWGEEALGRARAEDKPIFLSIGYSACHWCHVMERESFENEAVAAFLNQHFIAIKVDREERPDLDDIYMTCVQLLTGSGGWPMSVFLSSDGRPFYGGTYFPPEDRWGRPGFLTLLRSIEEAWREQRDQIDSNAGGLAKAIGEVAAGAAAEPEGTSEAGGLSSATLDAACDGLASRFDAHWGGFGGAPKFPPSMALALLLREHHRTGAPHLREMVAVTLDRMARGGICDQLGGGFHRYSVDGQWLVPHFEKMLYDNALLAPVYFDAWRATGEEAWRRVGRATLDYLVRDMIDGKGGLHSAEDADSEGVEGKYYVWTPEEIDEALGAADGELFRAFHDVRPGGNWAEADGASILNIPRPLCEFASERGESPDALRARFDAMREKLLALRRHRVAPLRDDKVLAGWNGLAIGALALGTQATGEPRYAEAAARAADFILGAMRDGEGGLLRAWRGGTAHIPAFLEDYAALAGGLVDLYETTFERRWLEAAEELGAAILARFADPEGAGFFSTDGRDPTLLARMKDLLDGATPSGTALAVHALRRLGRLLGREDFAVAARATLATLAGALRERPAAHHHLLCALADELADAPEIVLVGRRGDTELEVMLRVVWEAFLPGRTLLLSEPHSVATADPIVSPLLEGKVAIDGKPTVYVCRGGSCREPVTHAGDLKAMLEKEGPGGRRDGTGTVVLE